MHQVDILPVDQHFTDLPPVTAVLTEIPYFCDNGSQYVSDIFQAEITFLGTVQARSWSRTE